MARLSICLSRLTLWVTELWALSATTGAPGASTSPHASPDVRASSASRGPDSPKPLALHTMSSHFQLPSLENQLHPASKEVTATRVAQLHLQHHTPSYKWLLASTAACQGNARRGRGVESPLCPLATVHGTCTTGIT